MRPPRCRGRRGRDRLDGQEVGFVVRIGQLAKAELSVDKEMPSISAAPQSAISGLSRLSFVAEFFSQPFGSVCVLWHPMLAGRGSSVDGSREDGLAKWVGGSQS